MPTWNGAALREAREALGLTQMQVAERMGVDADAVRRVEGSYVRGGKVRKARAAKVLAYCQCLGLDESDFRNKVARLVTPTFVDFRPNDPYEEDPNAHRWRHSTLRIGIGELELEVQEGKLIRITDVRLRTDLFDHIASHAMGRSIPRKENYSEYVRLQHWCEWQAGETLNEAPEMRNDYAALGVVHIPNLPAEGQFYVDDNGLKREAMFSLPPSFVTWHRFVTLWAENPKDINFHLTVQYRVRIEQVETKKIGSDPEKDKQPVFDTVETLRVKFYVKGSDVQEHSREGLKLSRGFPAYLEPNAFEGTSEQ